MEVDRDCHIRIGHVRVFVLRNTGVNRGIFMGEDMVNCMASYVDGRVFIFNRLYFIPVLGIRSKYIEHHSENTVRVSTYINRHPHKVKN